MFGSMIVYPIAFVIGLVAALTVDLARKKRALTALGIASTIAAAIGALAFSGYFGAAPTGEDAFVLMLAATWCVVLAIAGFFAAAGARLFLSAAIRAFRGD